MTDNPHHEHLLRELTEQLKPVFSNSPQSLYLYLDDEHKACNKKFADLLGYSAPKEWIENQYPIGDVLEDDQEKAINAYMEASQNFKAANLSVTVVKKDGTKIPIDLMMVPLSYKDETFVLHFITPESKDKLKVKK